MIRYPNMASTNNTTMGDKCWNPLKNAAKYPQSAYTALTYSLQAKWQYLCSTMPLASEVLSPVEAVIHSKFLPAPLGFESIDDNFRSLLPNGVKQAGIGITDPAATADVLYSSSCSAMNLVVETMLQNSQLDLNTKEISNNKLRLQTIQNWHWTPNAEFNVKLYQLLPIC